MRAALPTEYGRTVDVEGPADATGTRRGLHAFGVMSMTAGSHTITLEGAYVNGTTAPAVYDRVIAAVDDG